MAYAGVNSTIANPPAAVLEVMGSTGGRGARVWLYKSTHTQLEMSSAGFITDGLNLGAQLGDVMLVLGSTTYVMSAHTVQARSSTGISLSAGLTISSAS